MFANLVGNVPRPPGAWFACSYHGDFISPGLYMEVLADADKARIVIYRYFGYCASMATSYTSLHIEVLQ